MQEGAPETSPYLLMIADKQVIDDPQLVEKGRMLKRPGNTSARDSVWLPARNVRSVEADPASGGLEDTTDQSKQHGFSRSVGTDDGKDLSAVNLKTHVGQGNGSVESLAEAFGFKHGPSPLCAPKRSFAAPFALPDTAHQPLGEEDDYANEHQAVDDHAILLQELQILHQDGEKKGADDGPGQGRRTAQQDVDQPAEGQLHGRGRRLMLPIRLA